LCPFLLPKDAHKGLNYAQLNDIEWALCHLASTGLRYKVALGVLELCSGDSRAGTSQSFAPRTGL